MATIKEATLIEREAERQIQILISDKQPAQELFEAYIQAQDKEAFAAGLIGNLILRHKQWQAERRRGAQV